MDFLPTNVLTFNCNSMIACPSRKAEFSTFLFTHDIKIALLCETFLKKDHVFSIPHYSVVRTDNDVNRGAGTAILIHNSVRYRRVQPPCTTSFDDVTGIQVYNETNTCTFYAVYVRNSTHSIDKACLNKLFASDDRVVLGGDFNARNLRWGCHSSNSRGLSLADYLSHHSLVQMKFPNSPSCYPSDHNRRPSVIDGFLTKNVDSIGNPSSMADLFSDHNPIVLQLSLFVAIDKSDAIDYRRVHWDVFRDLLDARLLGNVNDTYETNSEIEQGVLHFEDMILQSLRAATPRPSRSREDLPPCLKAMIRDKNRLRRLYQKPAFRNAMNKRTINELQHEIDVALREHENARLRNDLRDLRPYDNQMYVHLRRVTSKAPPNPPLEDPSGNVLYSDEQKASCLASVFYGVHGMNANMGDPSFNGLVNDTVEQYLLANSTKGDSISTSIDEIRLEIKLLKGSCPLF